MRRVALVLSAAAVLAASALAYGLWQLLERGFRVRPSKRPLDILIEPAGPGLVRLRSRRGTADPGIAAGGVMGLAWDGGYGRAGRVAESGRGWVTREFEPVIGALEGTVPGRLDSFAFPVDPLTAHGFPFEAIALEGELCGLPAWYIPGDRQTWAIFVHGKGAWRGESLRALPVVRELGMPALAITYRGDEGLASDPSGWYGYGTTEWRDLECAVRHARDGGAEDVVVFGYSMGGAIALSFVRNSELAGMAAGLVLDAPLLDLQATVRWQMRRYPGLFAAALLRAARLAGIDWRQFDSLPDADRLRCPILLFHGGADPDVPVATSDALAEARPDLVRYVRVAGAGHVLSWNSDPAAYEAALRELLQPPLGPRGEPAGFEVDKG
ncbi:MAG: alpha/beta hydrolase [Hyphomicrobiales bacterium]